MMAFLRRTVVGGALTILVVGIVGYTLWHAVAAIHAALEQLAHAVSIDTRFPALSALAILLLLATVIGLLLQTRLVNRMVEGVMAWLGDRFPYSRLVHGFELELVGLGKSPIAPALAILGDHEVLAFVMEELADGRYVVFAPGSPKPTHGSVYIVPRANVHLIDASHYKVAGCASHWGAGTKKMLESTRVSAQRYQGGEPR
jgi:uncharacterized membrane protein